MGCNHGRVSAPGSMDSQQATGTLLASPKASSKSAPMGVLGEAAVTHVLKSDGQSIPLAAFQEQVAAPQREPRAAADVGEAGLDFQEERSLAGPLNLLAVLEEQRLRREQESLEPQASSPRNGFSSPSSVFSLRSPVSPVPEDWPQEKEDRERSNTESTRASENSQELTGFVNVQHKESKDAATHEITNQRETMVRDTAERVESSGSGVEEKRSGSGRKQRHDCC